MRNMRFRLRCHARPLRARGWLAHRLFLTLLGCCVLVTAGPEGAYGRPQESSPDSPEAFRAYLSKLANAAPKATEKQFAALAGEIALPDHRAWFIRRFGEDEGQKLSNQYEKSLPSLLQTLRRELAFSSPGPSTEFRVERWSQEKAILAEGLDKVILAALKEPDSYYKVSRGWAASGARFPFAVFFYADGAFRYVPYGTFYALSGAPVRLQIGGNVQQAKLISQAAPVYPPLARQGGIQGTVRLQAIIGTDGSLIQIEVMTGHPLLIQAALDAVRQWRYEPTLLEGKPVEVVTTIDVIFTLSGSPRKP